MKTIHAKDKDGRFVPGWQFCQVKGYDVTKQRKFSGWQIRSPDNYTRFCEGNWQQFVPFANLVLTNYGLRPTIS